MSLAEDYSAGQAVTANRWEAIQRICPSSELLPVEYDALLARAHRTSSPTKAFIENIGRRLLRTSEGKDGLLYRYTRSFQLPKECQLCGESCRLLDENFEACKASAGI